MFNKYDKMRRGLLLGAFLSFTPKANAAVSKPQLKPTRVGQTIIWRGRKYTAIKSGKNIVWNNGVSLPSASPSISTSPSSPANSASTQPSPSSSVISNSPSASKSASPNIVGRSSDLIIGDTKIFRENDPYGRGARYIISRTKEGLIGFDNTCTHEGCGIEEILSSNVVRCGCHGAEFDALTGRVLKRPATQSLRPIQIQEVDGKIIVL